MFPITCELIFILLRKIHSLKSERSIIYFPYHRLREDLQRAKKQEFSITYYMCDMYAWKMSRIFYKRHHRRRCCIRTLISRVRLRKIPWSWVETDLEQKWTDSRYTASSKVSVTPIHSLNNLSQYKKSMISHASEAYSTHYGNKTAHCQLVPISYVISRKLLDSFSNILPVFTGGWECHTYLRRTFLP